MDAKCGGKIRHEKSLEFSVILLEFSCLMKEVFSFLFIADKVDFSLYSLHGKMLSFIED